MGATRPRLRPFDDERAAVRVLARAALALAAASLAFWITKIIAGLAGGLYLFSPFPIILATALVGGTAAGLATVLLLTAAFGWEFLEPARALAERVQAIRLVGFAVSSGLVAVVSGALRAAYRRTAGLRHDAEASAAQLRKLQEARDDLLRALTHDVRTPLSIIVNQAEVLRRGTDPAPGDVARRAEAIGTSARRIGAMVDDLVETFRLEAGQIALRRCRVELASFLAELATRLEGTLAVERVRCEVSPEAPAVDADPDRLERILVNLLSNALKYSPADAPVVVATEPAAGAVAVVVRDRGPGIPPAEAARIFDRFYRGAGARVADGLGLGLYITRLLVEAHGGRISLESTPERTAFRIVLPAPPAAAPLPPALDAGVAATPAPR